MLTCREMSELGSDIIDGQLGLRTRLAVFMHMHKCSRCSLYIEQLKVTSEVLQQTSLNGQSVDPQAILDKLNKPRE